MSTAPAPPKPDSIIISYMALRRTLGLLGISLVPLLIIGTIAIDHTNQIEPSASHY